MAEEIVQIIKCGGAGSAGWDANTAGRFLKRIGDDHTTQDVWVEVTDIIAREKVSHALRGGGTNNMSSTNNQAQQQQQQQEEEKLPSSMTDEKHEQSKKRMSGLEETVELMKEAKRRRIEEIKQLDLLLGLGVQTIPVSSQPSVLGGEKGSLLQLLQGIGQHASIGHENSPRTVIDSPTNHDLLAWLVTTEHEHQKAAAASRILKMVGYRTGAPSHFTPFMLSNGLY
jgi:hypothetical protein